MGELAARLRQRHAEIESTAHARVIAVDPRGVEDPEYAMGLRRAVTVALEYAFASLEAGTAAEILPVVPTELLEQARAAAGHEVSLDTVLRRYSVGHMMMGDFLVEEFDRADSTDAAQLREALRAQASAFDHLIAAISAEYIRALERRQRTTAEKRAQLVRALLGRQPVDTAKLHYPLELSHVAAITSDLGVAASIRKLAVKLGCECLTVEADKSVWVWLGSVAKLSSEEVLTQLEDLFPLTLPLALGEPAQGTEGWRLTHWQAKAAMSVAQRGNKQRVRYGDVALLAAALRDEMLAKSLHDIYLRPLEEEGGGNALRSSLRAYLAAGKKRLICRRKVGTDQTNRQRSPMHGRRANRSGTR